MKQFNLDEYIKNPSRKVVTRDGRRARIVCTDRVLGAFQVVALVMEKRGYENSYSYKTNGQYNENGISDSDLFFASEKHEKWTPVYRERTGQIRFGYAYSTKKEAEEASKYDTRYITTTNVEWEE